MSTDDRGTVRELFRGSIYFEVLAEIADELETTVETIETIYNAVCANAPEYDADKISEMINCELPL